MNELNPSATPLVGIDWGTTNRRVYLLDQQGEVIRQHADGLGILAVQGDFRTSLADLLRHFEVDRADVIMSGMVGSRNGWQEVPYLSVERPILALSDAMKEIDSGLPGVRCRIVPGYRFIDRHGMPDVMRGEETQVLGALVSGASDGWFVLPGTHSKWVAVEEGVATEIMTFMTGELFALLTQHGTLANLMQEQQTVPQAFQEGISAARNGGFTHMAFACRALVVTGAMPAAYAYSFLSGLLIGTELHEISRRTGSQERLTVQVIGSPTLAERYGAAMEIFGMASRAWQPDQIFLSALRFLAGRHTSH